MDERDQVLSVSNVTHHVSKMIDIFAFDAICLLRGTGIPRCSSNQSTSSAHNHLNLHTSTPSQPLIATGRRRARRRRTRRRRARLRRARCRRARLRRAGSLRAGRGTLRPSSLRSRHRPHNAKRSRKRNDLPRLICSSVSTSPQETASSPRDIRLRTMTSRTIVKSGPEPGPGGTTSIEAVSRAVSLCCV